jgi:hypothetical protein
MTEPYTFDETTPLLIEVSPTPGAPDDTREVLSLGPVVKQVSDAALRQAFNTIYTLARRTGGLIEALQHQERHASLNSVELEFGLKFDGNVDAHLAQTGSEATVTVKISWQPGEVPHD